VKAVFSDAITPLYASHTNSAVEVAAAFISQVYATKILRPKTARVGKESDPLGNWEKIISDGVFIGLQVIPKRH
jgi:hypothetical protein